LTGIGLVSLNTTTSKLKAAAYNLRSNLLFARSTAIKENKTVTVRFDVNGETYSAIKDDGTTLFKVTLENGLDLTTNNISISFSPFGTATNSIFYIKSNTDKCEIVARSSGRIYINGYCPQ
jgi:Tfp pilus assembly protein FimT